MKVWKKILITSILTVSFAVIAIVVLCQPSELFSGFQSAVDNQVVSPDSGTKDSFSAMKSKVAKNPVPQPQDYMENNLICTVADGFSAQDIVDLLEDKGIDVKKVEALTSGDLSSAVSYSIDYQGNIDPYKLSKELCYADKRLIVEPNYKNELYEFSGKANDEFLSMQSWLATSNIENAWKLATVDHNATVGILDTGIAVGHPDLEANYAATVDYAYNSYKDVTGINNVKDVHYHGTHCAGLAAACTNNSIGVAGGSFNANILPICISDENVNIYNSWVLKALEYVKTIKNDSNSPAAIKNLKAISMSFGSPYFSSSEQVAINGVYNSNVTCVAATGNDAAEVNYPGALNNVIGVGSVDLASNPSYFTNYGEGCDITAQGQADLSTIPMNYVTTPKSGYGNLSGTSMSTPIVAGLATLVGAANQSLRPMEIEKVLEDTARKVGFEGWDQYYGYGIADAEAAVKRAMAKKVSINLDGGAVENVPEGWELEDSYYVKYFDYKTDLSQAIAEWAAANPEKEYCEFKGWDKTSGELTSDVVVTAKWERTGFFVTVQLGDNTKYATAYPDGWEYSSEDNSYTKGFLKGTKFETILGEWDTSVFKTTDFFIFNNWTSHDETLTKDASVGIEWVDYGNNIYLNLAGGIINGVPNGWSKIADKDTYVKRIWRNSDIAQILKDWDNITFIKHQYVFKGFDKSSGLLSTDTNVNVVWQFEGWILTVDLNGGSVDYEHDGWTKINGKYQKRFDNNTLFAQAMADWDSVGLSKEGCWLAGWNGAAQYITSNLEVSPIWYTIQLPVKVNLNGGFTTEAPIGWYYEDGYYIKNYDYGTSVESIINEINGWAIYRGNYKFVKWIYWDDYLTYGTSIYAQWVMLIDYPVMIVSSSQLKMAVDVEGSSTKSGANVVTGQRGKTASQVWIMETDGNGDFVIRNKVSGKVLDVVYASKLPGTNVWQYEENGKLSQKWNLVELPNNNFKIASAMDNRFVLDISWNSSMIGSNIQIYTDNGSTAQKFKILSAN